MSSNRNMAKVCDNGDLYRILIRSIWEGNIKKDFNRIGCEDVEWTDQAHNRVKETRQVK